MHTQSAADERQIPTVYPESPNVRRTDPLTSHIAADRAVKRIPTLQAIEKALHAAGEPLTADEIWTRLRTEHGFFCSHERVRTVLNEGSGQSVRESVRSHTFVRLDETRPSDLGNPAHLWTLAEAAA
ncbi:hypothetical protein GCM10009775_04330 [Microbacterium aoyamense]|uniref:HTH HARE-type domain-containing protein n=1 Tax=Microbacterium aoyamense TaxID=344166 RepID=A0ABN2P8Q5_9MICO|nr:hypothetical protein [Microbacterium aoyamense]